MAVDWDVGRELALAAQLPSGTPRWIALFDGDPATTGTELALAGYARVAHQDWSTLSAGLESTRSNATTITFGPITGVGSADHWGIYDAAVGGNLIRSGQILDDLNQPIAIDIKGLGEEPQFGIQALRIKQVDE